MSRLFNLSNERVRWTEEEDAIILQHAAQNSGVHDWDLVAKKLTDAAAAKGQAGRTADAVRNHWHRLVKTRGVIRGEEAEADDGEIPNAPGVRPRTERQKWSAEEDDIIMRAVEELGKSWRAIAKRLPPNAETGKQRSDSSVRNRWERLMKKEENSSGSPSETPSPRSTSPQAADRSAPVTPQGNIFGLGNFAAPGQLLGSWGNFSTPTPPSSRRPSFSAMPFMSRRSSECLSERSEYSTHNFLREASLREGSRRPSVCLDQSTDLAERSERSWRQQSGRYEPEVDENLSAELYNSLAFARPLAPVRART